MQVTAYEVGIEVASGVFGKGFGGFADDAAIGASAAGTGAGQGFHSFDAFRRAMGRIGDNMNWHHIVGQTPGNLNRFGPYAIHNTDNIIRLDANIHRQISGFYFSKPPFAGGQRVREWLSTQSFEAQMQFGLEVLQLFGLTP